MHPDKNNHGAEAFRCVQEAYECLSRAPCRRDYLTALEEKEAAIRLARLEVGSRLAHSAAACALQLYRLLSIASKHYFLLAHRVWAITGMWRVTLSFLQTPLPLGRVALLGVLLAKGRTLLLLYFAAFNILRFNYASSQRRE